MDILDINSLPQQKKLFYHMHHGLAKAKQIQQYAIFLLGEIRSGKSTTFNWVTNPSCLIGKGNEISSQYLLREENEDIALVKNSYESVTLVQNKHSVSDGNKEALLIDLPGFHDSRTANEVMLVNFIIDCCFSHSTNAKFIIVISRNEFMNINGNAFINTIKQFVKYFRRFPEEQRKKIYKSAGLLITSVDVKSYDSYKEMYLLQLSQNLNKIKDLRTKNEEIKQYFSNIEELLLQLIHNKRLELFQMAKDQKSPQKSQILQQFNTCDWQYYNMKEHILDITYPYNEYYQRLSPEDQEKIDWQIVNRVKQFERLQDLFARVIQDYLKEPYNKAIDFSEHFNEIQQFVERNRVHNDELYVAEEDLIQESQELNPLKIYQNIESLINLTFEVQDNGCRPIQQQRRVNYFQYLLPFFKKTVKLFGNSFVISLQSQQTMKNIIGIFGQVIEELKYITQISGSLKSKCSYDLKQALMVMNKVYCLKEDVPKPFLKDLLHEDFENYPILQLEETIEFLQRLEWEKLDPRMKYYLLSKCRKAMAKLHRCERLYLQATQNALSSFENFMKYQFSQQIQKNFRRTTKEQIQCDTNFQDLSKELIEQIYIALYFSQSQQIQELLGGYSLLLVIKQSLSRLQEGTQKNQVYLLLQKYAKLYEQNGQYEWEIGIYKRLQNNPQIKAQKGRVKEIQQSQKIAESRLKTSYRQHNPELEKSFFKDENQVLKLMNQIRVSILKKQNKLTREQMTEQVSKYYKQRNIQANPNEFQYKISNDPSYFDIVSISQMLIKMIKNRKVVLMLGKRAGKTSAYYWLMKKPLTIKRIGNRKYVYDLNCANIKNRINHKGFHPTYIPNIGQFQQGELLVDFSNMFHKKIIHVMLQLNILKEILQNSESVKFLLVCKQEEVLKDDCACIFKIIEFCLSFMPKKERIYEHFALLITHYENSKKQKDGLQQFLEQFQTINHKQDLQQKYKVKIEDKKYYKEILSSFFQNKTILFPKADKDIPECNFVSFAKQPHWAYLQSPQNVKAELFSYIRHLEQQNAQIQQGTQLIKGQTKQIRSDLKKLGEVFYNSIEDREISRQILLQIEPSFSENWNHQSQVSYQKYPQIYHFNQIFALFELEKFFRYLASYASTIHEGRQQMFELFKLLKKLSFKKGEGMMVLSWLEAKFTQLIIPISVVNEFKFERFDYEIADLKYMVTSLSWANFFVDLFGQNIEKNMRNINVQVLVKEMTENKWKINQNLIKFIKVCFQIQKQNKIYSFVERILEEKVNNFVKMLKESTSLQQNHKNSLQACIVLFQLENRCCVAAFEKCQEAQHKGQLQIDFKIKLLDLLKEMALVLASLNEQFAFAICDLLQCHACKCSVFERILINTKKNDEVLENYLEFCLQVGLKNEYIEQCNKLTAVTNNEQMKERFNSIKYDILNGKRQLINKRRTAYDNLKEIKIQKLLEIFEEIKGYWNLFNIA